MGRKICKITVHISKKEILKVPVKKDAQAKGELNQESKYTSKILIRINKNAKNPYAILRSELEHARDRAKGEVPNQKVKHFNRYEGMNESEMALGYVKKKADSRAGRTVEQAPAEEPVLKTASENLEEFINNSERTWASVDTVLNDEAYKAEGLLDEYKNLPIQKMTTEEISELTTNGYQTNATLVLNENNDIIGIKLNPNLSTEKAKYALFHELGHAKQVKNSANAKDIEELINLTENIQTSKDLSNYLNNSLEKEADNFAEEMLQKKKDYYDNKSRKNAEILQLPKSNDNLENGSTGTGSKNNRGNSRVRIPENEGNGVNTTGSSAADTRPIEERAKSIKSENEASQLIDEAAQSYSKDTIPWKITAENAEDYYQKLRAKGLETTAIKEAISNKDVELANLIASKQLAAERLIRDIADELTKTTDEIAEYSFQRMKEMGLIPQEAPQQTPDPSMNKQN